MHKSRLPLLALVLLIGAIGLSACSKSATPTTAAKHKLRVAMVTDTGGINDMSFNANAWLGLQRAGKELGIDVKFVESKEQADYEANLRELAENGYDLVFAVGFLMKDATEKVAPAYPKAKFALIDSPTKPLPNVQSLVFREQEGAYLVGALAGAMNKTGTVGFVGGMDVPLIKRFEAGYKAGAATTRPGAKVLVKYTNNWVDIATGKEMALAEFNQGADIVFHASGRCGLGVIKAACERGKGFYAIGVDADQDYLGCADPRNPQAPSRVLTSMMKRVDNAVFSACQAAAEGKFVAGSRAYGLKEGGIDLSPMKYTRREIPPATLAKIEQLKKLIANGRLTPPADLDQLEHFQPPAL